MKKWIGILLCLVIAGVMAGCGNGSASSGRTGNQTAGVNDVLEEKMAEADAAADKGAEDRQIGVSDNAPEPEPIDDADTAESSEEGIDIDLTTMSSTMVYSRVYNMMVSPEGYIGKTIKMKGPFAIYYDEAADKYYFACIIQDATACCSQGIEFELGAEYSYPEDYPEEGEEICVVGVFDVYTEDQYRYATLRNAELS